MSERSRAYLEHPEESQTNLANLAKANAVNLVCLSQKIRKSSNMSLDLKRDRDRRRMLEELLRVLSSQLEYLEDPGRSLLRGILEQPSSGLETELLKLLDVSLSPHHRTRGGRAWRRSTASNPGFSATPVTAR